MSEDRAGLPEPLRENLVRAMPGIELQDAGKVSDGRLGTLVGRLANYNQWVEVDSPIEGHFMETIAPGAFTKTLSENRSKMKIVYDHGQDRNIGRKPLGPLEAVNDRSDGIDYEGALMDTSYNRDLLPGLKQGVYGSSYRFSIPNRNGEKWNYRPARSEHNPEGIPEHIVTEAKIAELGPTPFPVDSGTTAGVRSMTAEYLIRKLTTDPELATLIRAEAQSDEPAAQPVAAEPTPPPPDSDAALPDKGADESHSDEGSREEAPPSPPPSAEPSPEAPPDGGSSASGDRSVSDEERTTSDNQVTRADRPARITELRSLIDSFANEHDGELSTEQQSEWDGMTAELRSHERAEAADKARREFVADRAVHDVNTQPAIPAVGVGPGAIAGAPAIKRQRVKDIYSLGEIRSVSNGADDEKQLIRDSALRAIEDARFAHMDRSEGQTRVEKTLNEVEDRNDYIAHRILLTGNPTYRRALHKTLLGLQLNQEELASYGRFQEYERAMGQVTGSAGGFGVTFDLDPTMIQTSNGAVVPYRRAARVVQITTNEWRGVTSGGVVAAYAAEAAVSTDNSPTLAQPAALVQKAHCFVPFSMEIQGDYAGLEAELGREIQDAKDVLEAVQFTTGAGTTVFPQGIVTGSTTGLNTGTTLVLAAADLYATEFTLAPRFRTNARWFANRAFYNRIRAIDTAGGAQLWTQNLTVGLDSNKEGNTGMRLLGYPAEEASGFSTSIASTTKMAVFGDASYFVIVDRVGLNLELVPILTQQATAGTGFGMPTGQRGVYAWWRNTTKVLSAAAFITLTGV